MIHTFLFLILAIIHISPLEPEPQQPVPEKKTSAVQNPPSPTKAPQISLPIDADSTKKEKESTEQQSKWWPPPPPWDIYWPTATLGLFAAYIAICTLADLRKQTKAAKDAADAALLNAQALIGAERAWVMAHIASGTVTIHDLTTASGEEKTSLTATLIYENVGRTPCWITNISIWFRLITSISAEPDFTNPTKEFRETWPLNLTEHPNVPLNGLICDGVYTVALAGTGGNFPILYGFIRYRDVFGKNRETRFGFKVKLSQQLERIPRDSYNRND